MMHHLVLPRSRRAAVLALAAALSSAGVRAQEPAIPGSRAGFSIGPRTMHYKATDAEEGTWSGGVQARGHFTPVLAAEGSVDYRQTRFSGAVVDIMPVQASLLVYLFPGIPITPYILAGAGWYYTHLRDPLNDTQSRWGPHAGAGVELFMSRNWSMDTSWRHIWNGDIHTVTASRPVGRDLNDNGNMFTIGLNYFFGR